MASIHSVREQAHTFRELATLVGAGITISTALATVNRGGRSLAFGRFLARAERRVGQGEKLSVAMRDEGELFAEPVVALVEAAETSGRLEQTLHDVSDHMERELRLHIMIARETLYAKILVAATVFVPLTARTVMELLAGGLPASAGVLLRGLLLYALMGGLPALVLYRVYRHLSTTPGGKDRLDAAKLNLASIGPVIERLALARFARTLAALYEAGVPYARSVSLAAAACGNRSLGHLLRSALPLLEEGNKLSEALATTRLRDSLLVRLLQTGEQTGEIDKMLIKAADHYEAEAQGQIRRLTVAIVPVVVILTGLIIGVMVVRFYMGLYTRPF